MNAISTTNLTKYYGSGRKKSRGILDVTLSVPEGDFFGFIGPNGAGKSTTIRILLGLIAPSDGSAELLGKNILAHKQGILPIFAGRTAARKQLAFVNGSSLMPPAGSMNFLWEIEKKSESFAPCSIILVCISLMNQPAV